MFSTDFSTHTHQSVAADLDRSTSGTGLDDLVYQAEQLMADVQGENELPRITRSLSQMRQQGERWSVRAGAHNDVKAARLLGAKAGGLELPQSLAHKLEMASGCPRSAYEMGIGGETRAPDTDIQTFLKNERENVLLTAIEQTRCSTFDESDKRRLTSVQNWWDLEKQKIMTTLVGSGSSPELPDLHSIVGSDSALAGGDLVGMAHTRTTLTRTELNYARQIDRYLTSHVPGQSSDSSGDLCSLLSSSFLSSETFNVDAPINSQVDPELEEFWRLVDHVTDIKRHVPASSGTAQGGLQVRSMMGVQKLCVSRAIEQLESALMMLIRKTVDSNPRQARLGGRPGTAPLVKAFLTIRLAMDKTLLPALEDGTVDEKPVWPMIYLCIRGGDLKEALEISKRAANNLGKFSEYLEAYIRNNRSLPADLQADMRMVYKRTIKNGTDPYKRLVYCVIGCCDPVENHGDVATSIDDFLWLKLSQLSWYEGDDDNLQFGGLGNDCLTLAQLQKQLYEDYGEVHFDAGRQPLLYFKVLFLTQQFEAALAFLSRFDALRCHAVHAALVLRDRDLLILSKSVQAQLVYRQPEDPSGIRRLNLVRMVMIYTRKFEVTDPREALNYFYFLNNLQLDGQNVFFTSVAELALETREFELLLGRVDQNGKIYPGAVERFGVNTNKLISHVADVLERRGHLEDASGLYELSGDLDKAILLVNQLLSANLTQPPSVHERQQILDRAKRLGSRIRQSSPHPTSSAGKSLFFLLDLSTFFDMVHSGDVETALTVMDSLRIVPTRDQVDLLESRIRTFAQLPEEIRRAMPQILLATMRCLTAKMNLLRKQMNRPLDTPLSPRTDDVRAQAKVLVTFAGRLPYRMPADVYAKLSQMDMEMM